MFCGSVGVTATWLSSGHEKIEDDFLAGNKFEIKQSVAVSF